MFGMGIRESLYLNGWFPPLILNDHPDEHYYLMGHRIRDLGEWAWVGRVY